MRIFRYSCFLVLVLAWFRSYRWMDRFEYSREVRTGKDITWHGPSIELFSGQLNFVWISMTNLNSDVWTRTFPLDKQNSPGELPRGITWTRIPIVPRPNCKNTPFLRLLKRFPANVGQLLSDWRIKSGVWTAFAHICREIQLAMVQFPWGTKRHLRSIHPIT